MTDNEDPASPSRRRYSAAVALVAATPADDGLTGVAKSLQQLCRAAASGLSMRGAAVTMGTGPGPNGVVASSDPLMRLVDELQFTTGEGPCHEALALHRPLLTPDLTAVPGGRWPGFATSAIESGVLAAFSFPLQVGASSLGVLTVYHDRAGWIDDEQVATALTFARVGTVMLFGTQTTLSDGSLEPGLDEVLEGRFEIHQAQGMVMIDLGVDLEEALVRMRAHAYSTAVPLIDLAREIIGGGRSLERDVLD